MLPACLPDGSSVKREFQALFCEKPEVQSLRLTLPKRSTPVAHAQAPATSPPSRPLNIILVLRDQTRHELPLAVGYNTPALDRLAQQGIVFRNHYIASAMCTPSRAALYSGQPPQVPLDTAAFDRDRSGDDWVARNSRWLLPGWSILLLRALRRSGYGVRSL